MGGREGVKSAGQAVHHGDEVEEGGGGGGVGGETTGSHVSTRTRTRTDTSTHKQTSFRSNASPSHSPTIAHTRSLHFHHRPLLSISEKTSPPLPSPLKMR